MLLEYSQSLQTAIYLIVEVVQKYNDSVGSFDDNQCHVASDKTHTLYLRFCQQSKVDYSLAVYTGEVEKE